MRVRVFVCSKQARVFQQQQTAGGAACCCGSLEVVGWLVGWVVVVGWFLDVLRWIVDVVVVVVGWLVGGGFVVHVLRWTSRVCVQARVCV